MLEQAIQRGDGDLVLDVIDPITGMNMCALVGLPVDHWKRFSDPFREAVIVNRAAPEFDEVAKKLDDLKAELRSLIEARRAQPRDDLISRAIQAEIEGVPVPDDVTAMDLFLIVSGGADTVAGLLSNALMHLHRDRNLRARLIADPSLIPLALEEFNRYYTPVTALARTVKTPCTLGRTALGAGVIGCYWRMARPTAMRRSSINRMRYSSTVTRIATLALAWVLVTASGPGSHAPNRRS